MHSTIRTFGCVLAALALVSCGGGGGGSSSGGGNPPADPGSFTLSATTAAFSSYQTRPEPAAQTVTLHLTNASNVAAVGAGYTGSNQPANWLSVNITGAASDFTISLAVVPGAAVVGTQRAVITVGTANAAGGILKSRNITVDYDLKQLTIVGPNATFSANTIHGHDSVVRTYDASITAPPGVTWTAISDQPWLRVPNTVFTGPAIVTVTIDASAQTPGPHMGNVTWAAQGDAQNYTRLPASLTVTEPVFSVGNGPIVLGGEDGVLDPVATLPISLGTGTRAHPYTVAINTSNGVQWLTAQAPTSNVAAAGTVLTLNGLKSAVTPGAFSARLTITATVDGLQLTQDRDVVFNWERHSLVAGALGVGFSKFPGRSVLERRVRVTSNYGLDNVPWQATKDAAWLSVTPNGLTGGDVVLTANPAGLAAGQLHRATVTVASNAPYVGNQQVIRVALWIGTSDPVDSWVATTGYQIAVSPVDPRAFIGESNGDISVHDVYTGALINTFPAVTTGYSAGMVLSDDGLTLFVADYLNSRVLMLDPVTGASQGAIDGVSNDFVYMRYARPDAHPVLMLGSGEVVDVATGNKFMRELFENNYRNWQNFATTTSQRYLYSQNSGISASTLIRYRVGYTSLFTDHWYARETGRTSGGENGQDICVSADDSRLYTANGYPYVFRVFDAGSLALQGPLAATSYPQSTECSWNGLFAGGTFGGSADPYNLWVYDESGNELQALLVRGSGHEVARDQVHFTPDATRMVIVTGGPSLSLNFVNAPAH